MSKVEIICLVVGAKMGEGFKNPAPSKLYFLNPGDFSFKDVLLPDLWTHCLINSIIDGTLKATIKAALGRAADAKSLREIIPEEIKGTPALVGKVNELLGLSIPIPYPIATKSLTEPQTQSFDVRVKNLEKLSASQTIRIQALEACVASLVASRAEDLKYAEAQVLALCEALNEALGHGAGNLQKYLANCKK